MKMEPILEELEAAAEKLGVKVSYENLADTAFGGGLCKVKGTYRVIIDKRGTASEKAVTLAKALSELQPRERLDEVFLTPATRELVQRHQ
jgi:hypothetical protein